MTTRIGALVIPVLEWPEPGAGGPAGFTHLLCRALMSHANCPFPIYLLHTRRLQLVKLTSTSDLKVLSQHHGASLRSTLKKTANAAIEQAKRHLPTRAAGETEFIKRGLLEIARQRRVRHKIFLIRRMMTSLVEKHGAVICHGHYVETTHLLLSACSTLQFVSLVHTEHSKGGAHSELIRRYGDRFARHRIIARFIRQYQDLLDKASWFTFPSFGAMTLFEECYGKLSNSCATKAVLPTGVNIDASLSQARPDKNGINRLFAIASHIPEKGVDRMIRTIAAMNSRGISVQLRIAGAETNLSPDLYKLANTLHVSDHITFMGRVSHGKALEELYASDVFLACPRVTVFDLSLIEAMAVGKPIVTSKLAGNVEALGADYEGFFEADEGLPLLLNRILSSPDLQARMGKQNRMRFEENFTMEHMAERYLDLYSGLLKAISEHGREPFPVSMEAQ